MGCQYNKKNEGLNDEISENSNSEDLENNNDQKDEIFGL
jgi:hypothetical protein